MEPLAAEQLGSGEMQRSSAGPELHTRLSRMGLGPGVGAEKCTDRARRGVEWTLVCQRSVRLPDESEIGAIAISAPGVSLFHVSGAEPRC
jgi:hypothetical protein